MFAGDLIRLGLFLGVFGFVTAVNVVAIVRVVRPVAPGAASAGAGWARVTVAVLLPLQAAAILYGLFIEPRQPELTRHRVVSARMVPGTVVNLVHLSDLHLETIGRPEEKLLGMLRTIAPDMILITGDLVNRGECFPLAAAYLRRVRAVAPVYLIAGNIDVCFPAELAMLKHEFTFLDGGLVSPALPNGARLLLAGADDGRAEQLLAAAAALPIPAAGAGAAVLLYHKPDLAREPWVRAFDLYLCGHTHGGQVRLPWYGALITCSRFGKAFEAGRYDLGPAALYVNRGWGLEGGGWFVPRVRFLCRPEVAWFTITAP
ncbi:MAG: metallophosphoesterase [Planctomycetota bacterium]